MLASTTLLSLLAFAAATPIPIPSTNMTTTASPQATTLDCYTPSGTLSFSESSLRRNLAAFPDSAGASGFSHRYGNFESFFWDFNKAACDAAPALLEMPVFENGRLYGWDTAPRPYPGPVRLVYEADGDERTFCGLIVHAAGTGAFVKCVVA